MGIINPIHLIFVAAIALVVLGPKRLPELARSLGHGINEFRESMSEAVSGTAKDEQHTTQAVVAQQAIVPPQAHLVPLPESVDPAQAIRSEDAPDSRSL